MKSTSGSPSWTKLTGTDDGAARFQGADNLLAILVFIGCAAAYMIFAGLISSPTRQTNQATSAVMTTQAIVDHLQSLQYGVLASAEEGSRQRYYDAQGHLVEQSRTEARAYAVTWNAQEVSEKVPPRLNVTVTIASTTSKTPPRRVHFVKTKGF